jgi:hypothetical protein
MARVNTQLKSNTVVQLGEWRFKVKSQRLIEFIVIFLFKLSFVLCPKGIGFINSFVWTSNGKGKYSTEKVDCPDFGTSITLHIKADEAEFLVDGI